MNQPWLLQDGHWKKLELAPRWRVRPDEHESLQIFFGRDHRPRLMGWRWLAANARVSSEPHARQVYLRWRRNAWRDGKTEIGRLSGKPAGALYGILGFEDLEVVCKTGDVCIVKRRTGWSTFPAPRRPLRVIRSSDHPTWALALDSPKLLRLTSDRWQPYEVNIPERNNLPFSSLASRNGQVWLLTGSYVYACVESKCTIQQSPLRDPKALLGTQEHDSRLWLVGRDGMATYDGNSWTRVKAPDDAPHGISRDPQGNLWLLGQAHLWRATIAVRDENTESVQ